MSENLIYKEIAGDSKIGWSEIQTVSSDTADKITDPTNQKKENLAMPKTSVPSPYARFFLVKEAFEKYVKNENKGGVKQPESGKTDLETNIDTKDKLLISQSLDVLQLFYEGIDESNGFSIIEWSIGEAIERLRDSNNHGTKMLGETLHLYREQEKLGFEAGKNDCIYIICYNSEPIGCTSPISIFIASPNYLEISKENEISKGTITINGDSPFLGMPRMLYERQADFVEYVYALSKYLGNENFLDAFRKYLDCQKENYIRKKNLKLNSKIDKIINFDALSDEYIEQQYNNDTGVFLFGRKIFARKDKAVDEMITNESHFVIDSQKGSKKPLVLTNYNSKNYDGWHYMSSDVLFDSKKHKIDYIPQKRDDGKDYKTILPGTGEEYKDGWVCESDFLSDYLFILPYKLDTEHFYDGNSGDSKSNYLIPIKKRYFDFFDISTIYDPNHTNDNCGSSKRIEIKEKRKGNELEFVEVTLRIPTKKGSPVVLYRKYDKLTQLEKRAGSSLNDLCVGRCVELSMMVSIFPFFKLPKNHYNIQLAIKQELDNGYRIEINHPDVVGKQEWWKSTKRSNLSQYYSCKKDIDYLQISITDGSRVFDSVLIPKWPNVGIGTGAYTMAFDFGTSNSHIAIWNEVKQSKEDFSLEKSVVSTIDFNIDAKSETFDFKSLGLCMRQEFLPMGIGDKYTFPIQTVLLQNKSYDINSETPVALRHLNIPFIYGKEDYDPIRNFLKSNIKWDRDNNSQWAGAFIEELALLSRAYVIEHNGDLSKTKVVWTYPLSMNSTMVENWDSKWRSYYKDYFDEKFPENVDYESTTCKGKIKRLSESVAPLLYYIDNGMDFSSGLLIDIGGGTCDVLIKEISDKATDEIKITSFRFAGDVIFDAGLAKDNPMIQEAFEHFEKKSYWDSLGDMCGTMDTARKRDNIRSAELNSFLFALEKHPSLVSCTKEDKSYNIFLSNNGKWKILFIYFYSAIIYYLTRLMTDNGYESAPNGIMLSGTGSKILDIIGQRKTLSNLTKKLISIFSGGKYSYEERSNFEIYKLSEPKKATAEGALHNPKNPNSTVDLMARFDDPDEVNRATIHYSMVKKNDVENLTMTYSDLVKQDYQAQIVGQIDSFNKLFENACLDLGFVKNLGCKEDWCKIFLEKIKAEDFRESLKVYIKNNYQEDINNDSRENTEVENPLFFGPIISFIQNSLIPNFK